MAISVARFTLAVWTPSVRLRKRSMRLTHEAHVMPSMGNSISVGAASARSIVILLGSISDGAWRSPDEVAH